MPVLTSRSIRIYVDGVDISSMVRSVEVVTTSIDAAVTWRLDGYFTTFSRMDNTGLHLNTKPEPVPTPTTTDERALVIEDDPVCRCESCVAIRNLGGADEEYSI